jgi:galactitol-specific phosphotransferase system IIB component
MLASETSTMLKKYIKKFNVDLNLTTYVEKENLGYYQADLQIMLQLFKEEIDNIETRVFKHFNYLLSKKDLQNDIKTFIIFKELDNHITNFYLKFFCFRMRSMLSNDSAIKVEFANAIQNYIIGKL